MRKLPLTHKKKVSGYIKTAFYYTLRNIHIKFKGLTRYSLKRIGLQTSKPPLGWPSSYVKTSEICHFIPVYTGGLQTHGNSGKTCHTRRKQRNRTAVNLGTATHGRNVGSAQKCMLICTTPHMTNPYLLHISKLAPSPCTARDLHEIFLGAYHQAKFRG